MTSFPFITIMIFPGGGKGVLVGAAVFVGEGVLVSATVFVCATVKGAGVNVEVALQATSAMTGNMADTFANLESVAA